MIANNKLKSGCRYILYVGIVSLLIFSNCVREIQRNREVNRFKHYKIYKIRPRISDTLILNDRIISWYETINGNVVKTVYKAKNLIKEEYYYDSDVSVKYNVRKEIAFYDSNFNSKGLGRAYDLKGNLICIKNYDNNELTIFDSSHFRNIKYLNVIKHKSDSILVSCFGEITFYNNIFWSSVSSLYTRDYLVKNDFGPNYTVPSFFQWWNDTDVNYKRPNTYEMVYDIKVGRNEYYDAMIILKFDSIGNVHIDTVIGPTFQLPIVDVKSGFKINKDSVYKNAKLLGLQDSDMAKATVTLRKSIDTTRKYELFNGYYTYDLMVPYKHKTVKYHVHDSKDSVSYYFTFFNVYSYSPWSGKFLRSQKYYNYALGEKYSADVSDLIPLK